MKEKKTMADFACEHPFITAFIIGYILDTIVRLFGGRPVSERAATIISKKDIDDAKPAGSTEEEENGPTDEE